MLLKWFGMKKRHDNVSRRTVTRQRHDTIISTNNNKTPFWYDLRNEYMKFMYSNCGLKQFKSKWFSAWWSNMTCKFRPEGLFRGRGSLFRCRPLIRGTADEWATTKQACRDELARSLSLFFYFTIYIYFPSLYIYIFFFSFTIYMYKRARN